MGAAVTRLKRRAEFLRVAGSGRKWAAPGVILQALKRPADAPSGNARPYPIAPDTVRLGFTVSRKVGNAVKRNRARRRLRAAANEVIPALAKPGYDLVLIGRGQTLTRPYAALLDDLTVALKRVGALREGDGMPHSAKDNDTGEPR